MKTIKTIPVYNLKSQKLTSIYVADLKAIKEETIDTNFFDVQDEFIIIKNKFFKSEHLVRYKKCYIQMQELSFERDPNVNYKKVLFILESPHRHEYNYDKGFQTKMPLSGSLNTFRTSFNQLMTEITEEDSAYEVTLYNPVPYQTSLHYLFRKSVQERTRFNFWLHGWWNMKYHRDFDQYLERNAFDYYINASTRAYKSIISFKLSTLIATEYQVYHPGSGFWNRKEVNFGIKKIIHLDDSHCMFNLPEKEEALW
ncbi:MAG: hypothetical protein HRT68_08635 [Flavobacteriaceae bacterium]|nr:hypothetical protein [Flavobacteriaceae bacterium]